MSKQRAISGSRFFLSLALLLASSGPLFASKLKTWLVQSPSSYADARFENAVISNQGSIRLARLLKPIALPRIDATHVWDVVEDKAGNLILAVGGEGRLLKVTPAGDVSVLHETKVGPVLSLALAPDGNLFAGTGPDGRILQMSPRGEVKTLCNTGESYIWSLVYQPDTQLLFAATGPKGRILKVSLDGKFETFFNTKQEHVLCMAGGEGGMIYAGTDKRGLVYRIDAKGKGYVLFQAPQGEVRSLLATPEALYAGTSAPTRKRSNSSPNGPGGPAVNLMPLPKPNPSSTAKPVGDGPSAVREASKDNEKSIPAAAPSSPGTGENSVYRIAPDGSVREVFREKALMLCLLKVDGRLLVGTGMDGKLFEVDEATRDFTEVARPDVGQILRLARRADGSVVAGTGDGGHLLTMQEGVAAKGNVISEVYDAKLISKWGAFTWRADVPKGSSLSFAVRGGNTSEPDETWSNWSAEFKDPAKAAFTGPSCRFAQYRATMHSDDGKSTPVLNSVSMRYATANQPPEMASIETPDLESAPQKDPKKVTIKWKATDPNEDDLTFDVLIRKDGWNDWVRVEEGFGKTEYEWDTTTIPSGIYRVKIVASDRPDNTEAAALTGSRVSSPVLVAHEAPQVAIKVLSIENGKATFEATATAPLARLAGATYSINGKRWENVFPTDGLFDGKEKTIRFTSDALQIGSNVAVIRVKDVAGNVGTGDVVFTAPKK
jgi:hypothetical protein